MQCMPKHQLFTRYSSSSLKGLLPVCRAVVEIVHNTRLCIEVLNQLAAVQNNHLLTMRIDNIQRIKQIEFTTH